MPEVILRSAPLLLFCLLLCWLSVLVTPARAIEHNFHRIGVDDGLPNATIYGIGQDTDGFIWLSSTNSGLLRYDGYQFAEFEVLTASELVQQGSHDVGTLLIDSHKHIWAGTWGYGLSRLDAKTGQLARYLPDANDANSLAGRQVQVLFEDLRGNIWVGSTNGLNRISPDLTMQRIDTKEQPLASNRIWSLAQTDDGTIWVGTSAGLHSYGTDGKLSAVMLPFPSGHGRDNEIRALYANGDQLWVGSRNGLFVLNRANNQFESVPFFAGRPPPIINVMMPDKSGMLLVGTYNGLMRVHPQLRQFIKFRQQEALLPTVNVRSLYLDRTGVLWVGSRENGLYYNRHSKSAFASLLDLAPKLDPAQLGFGITAVYADSHYIWLGSAEHIYRFSRSSQQLTAFHTGGRVNAIEPDGQGNVYVATDIGLFLLDNTQIHALPQPFNGLSVNANIRDLVVENNHSIWIGLWGDGVLHWDPQQGTAKHYLQRQIRAKVGEAVQAMQVTADKVWVGSRYSGVFVIDRNNGQVSHYSEEPSTGLQLPSPDIQCLEQGPAATLLLCTPLGLTIFDPATKRSVLVGKDAGLLTTNVFGAYTDQQQNIWLMSAKGLSLRPAGSERVITFTRQDGLVATELVFKALYDDQQGTFYIGTIEGLSLVEPALLWINEIEPKVAVSRVLVNNKPLPLQAHTARWPAIVLTPNDTSIEFEFASMDFHDVQRNQYMYRLTNFDQEWIRQPGRRSAYYSNLPPGDYVLEMRGSNNHGLYNQQPETVQLRVLPAWWQYRSVQVLLALLTLVLILIFHQYRLRHMQQINRLLQASVQERAKAQLVLETRVTERTRALEESSMTLSLRTRQLEKSLAEVAKANRELKRLDNLKDEFISTVSHELRTPLTSIRGAIGLVAQQVVPLGSVAYQQLVDTALQNCERLSALINDLLDVQKFEAGKFMLNSKQLDLAALCREAVSGIESYAVRYQVKVVCTVPTTPAICQCDALRIRQVIDNLLSNAVKFSPAGSTVTLQLTAVDELWQVEVIDHGEGIPEQFKPRIFEKFSQADASDSRSREGTGLGLTICKRIIEGHGGSIGFHSEEGQGSVFWFRLARAEVATS